jgi:dolichol-phosphate mannosyltransferase
MAMIDSISVSIVLPCFNERGNLPLLIEAVHKELSFCKHEIIVVDDNSPDGTYELVKSLQLDYVKVFLRESDPSLAKSIRKGLEEAGGNIFVIMDSDFNHQPEYLARMVKNIEFYDCVYASRFVYGGAMDNWFRYNASWVFNLFIRLLMNKAVTENLYGYLAIRKEMLEKMDFNKIFWGYGDYCIRLTYYLQLNKASILQIPAKNGKRVSGEGNKKLIKTFALYTLETLKLVFSSKK